MMDALLEKLVESPRLSLYVRRLNDMLAEEQARRARFHEEIDEGVKQEFINGKVIVASPVRLVHEQASSLLFRLLADHVDSNELGYVGHEKLMISLTRNDYEPDVCFWRPSKSATFAKDQMHFPPPDFIAEVLSESTEAIDRGIKFEDYAAHGVGEYWILDPESYRIEQYLLENDEYRLRLNSDSGIICSEVVHGFEIPIRAVFDKREYLAARRAGPGA